VREHVCGWDMTLSAPKSVSVMALVAGDRRLLDAQRHAVDTTIAYVERNAAATRIRQGDEVEHVATGKLVVANFPHITARETEHLPDPQLHDHDVVLNVTQDATGQSRSIDSRPLYRIVREADGVYHQALAFEIVQLGYTVSFNADGTFEIDGVPLEVRQYFSSRSAQIEAELAARGKTRKTASVAEKATIALDTRAPKEQVNRRALVNDWRARADTIGFTEEVRRTLIADAEARAAGLPVPTPRQRRLAADQAVASGAAHLAERESVFSAARLERAAGNAGRGRVAHADILAAITRAERRDHLIARDVAGAAKGTIGFTTSDAIQTEQAMLAMEAEGRDRLQPLYRDEWEVRKIVAAAKRRSADHGHSWTQGQIDATKGLLQSPHRVTGIQGSAGTAKTTTVLAAYADAGRAQGLEVRALAPLATAADVLGDAIGAEPMTIARMLIGDGDDIVQDGEVWVVDEASMAGARDTEALLARARKAGARVVLVGDVDQLGSVEAGRAFGQLQDAGMKTFKLDEIVRQPKGHTRTAVEAMLARDAEKAFAALDAGIQESLPDEARNAPGADCRGVREYADTPTRHAIIARDFAQLSREERANTLVLDPTRAGRQALTDAIRLAQRGDGTLGEDALVATILESRGLARAQAKQADSYQPGDIVTFRQSEKGRPRPGKGYRVEAVDTTTGTVRLVPDKGRAHDWQPARWGADVAEAFTQVEHEFRAGDWLQFTRNNYRAGRLNGHTAEVVAIDPAGSSMVVARDDGRREMPDMTHLADRHVRHGWVRAIHSAQGATSDRVLAHVESYRANIVDARAVYLAISRARKLATLYTDSRADLTEALGIRDGAQVGAIDDTMTRQKGAAIATPAPVNAVGMAIE
jgi:conjugative relaxase-like TrwC/TraI family protein